MKKILVYLEIGIFLLLLSFLFVYGDASALTVDNFLDDYIYKRDYKDTFQRNGQGWFDATSKTMEGSQPINGYFTDVYVRTNKLTNYYQWTNTLVFRESGLVSSHCNKGTCEVKGQIYALENDYSVSSFDYLKDAEVSFGVVAPNISASNYYSCELEKKDYYYEYTCNVPVNVSTNGYGHLRIDLKNKPFQDVTSASTYEEKSFKIGVGKTYNYECSLFDLPQLSVNIDGGTVTINVTNMDSFTNNSDFALFQVRHQHQTLGLELSNKSTYVYENVPNGTYEFSIAACKAGPECGARNKITYTVTNSDAPTAQLKIEDDGKKIQLDGSDSFGKNSIVKYYFKVYQAETSETEWVVSDSPVYTFDNQEYGMYHVKFKVEDSEGNVSRELITSFAHRSPTDKLIIKISEFIDNIKNGIGNISNSITTAIKEFWSYWESQLNLLWIGFKDATKSLFIPSNDFLKEWFDDLYVEFDEQFGFLSYPVTWTITFLERYLTLEDTGHYYITWNAVRVPNFDFTIIEGGSFDLATLLQNDTLRNMHDIYIMSVNALILIAFFALCYKTYDRIFNNPSSTYETLTVSEGTTTTFNDTSGEVRTVRRRSESSSVNTSRKVRK